MDANLVNPDDIESISVLKDAASASIYGARVLMALSWLQPKKVRNQTNRLFLYQPWLLAVTGIDFPQCKLYAVSYYDGWSLQNDGGSGHYFKSQVYQYAERFFNGK